MGDWRPFVYGGLASMTAECGTFPIDTTKTRLQVQGQRIDAKLTQLKYRGMFHALVAIAKEEGPRALYSGISPALLRQATYGTIKIGIYHSLKRLVVENPKDETLVVNVACGIVAGIISSSIANPTDVLKVRMQANTMTDEKKSMMRSFLHIYQQEGVKGLWRGVVPTAQRAAIIAGVELPVYDFCKKYILRYELLGDNMGTHFISSFFAGLAGAIFSTPVDVVKTRLMNQKKLKISSGSTHSGKAAPVIYTSSLDCIVQTVRHEGFMALYKGFVPSWVRLGPWNIIGHDAFVPSDDAGVALTKKFFMTYEQLKKMH